MSSDDPTETKVHVTGFGDDGGLSKSRTSTQLPERRINTLGHGVKPPYNPAVLASYLELNETLATGIRKKSRYEVGYGFDVVPHDRVDPDEADEQQRELVESFWYGRNSRWQTAPDESAEPTTPEEVKELARQDYHGVGWCCLEILVNLEGVPVGAAYVPAKSVRVRKPQSRFDQPRHPEDGRFVSSEDGHFASRGYVQVRNGQRRYFGEAGDRYRGLDPVISGGDGDGPPTVQYQDDGTDEEPIFVDKFTGDVVTGSAENLPNAPANELIYVKNPSILEQDYGVPDWVPAIRTITADEAAKDYNREFFDNDTIPRMVIKVTGGELTEESKQDLRQMLHGLREEHHRTVILEVEKFANQLDEEVTIEIQPISQGISEEMSFQAFREKNEAEIAKVLEVPPIKIGNTGTSNRSNSDQQDRDFALEVIQPEQNKWSERLYQIIHQQAFGVSDWTLEYELRGADQPKEDAEVARRKIQAVNGAVPVNRALAMVGEDPLPDEHPVDGDSTLVADVGASGGPPGQEVEQARPDYLPPVENRLGFWDWDDVRGDVEELADLAKQPQNPIEQQQFDSSNLADGIFDFFENHLWLSFLREDGPNSLYVYTGVPTAEWAGLVNAGSHGSYHHANIRLSYPYWEVTNFHDRLPEGEVPEDIPEGVPSEI